MVKKTIIIAMAILVFTSSQALGWFSWAEDYDKCYIAGANPDQHLEPEGIDDAPDGVEVTLPLTIRVHTRSSDFPIQRLQLQWKVKGASTWTDIEPTYEDTDENFEFDWNEMRFGRAPNYTLTSDEVTPGDTILVRIYIANLSEGYQNASMDVDTTAEGTNGWEDPWVIELDTKAGNTRPSMPGGN